MLMTVLEAQVEPDRAQALQSAYEAAAAGGLPPGLLRTELVRDLRHAGRWRIQTWWTDRQALDAMRSAGTPAGVLMFRAAGAEPELSVFEVLAALPRA